MSAAVTSPGRPRARSPEANARTAPAWARLPAAAPDRLEPAEHPRDVGVGGRGAASEGEGGDRRRPCTRRSPEAGGARRVGAATVLRARARSLGRRAGGGAPGRSSRGPTRPREPPPRSRRESARRFGKRSRNALVAAAHRADRRLLEHHLGDPDAVRIPRPSPGEASRLSGETRRAAGRGRDRAGTADIRRRSRPSAARSSPASFMRSRTNVFSLLVRERPRRGARRSASGASSSPVTEYVWPANSPIERWNFMSGADERRRAGREELADRLRGASRLPGGRARARARSSAPCRARPVCRASSYRPLRPHT